MHATLAYLNAAGRRATYLTRNNSAFMQVMDTLLANTYRASRRKAKTQRRPARKDAAQRVTY
jgi:hypothetical protein